MASGNAAAPKLESTWDNLVSGPGLPRAMPAARMGKRSVARMPAPYRERPKPHAPVCLGLKSSASGRELDFPVPGVLDRTPAPITLRQARYGPAAGRKSRQAGERGSLYGAGKRRARSEVCGRTARGKIISVGGARHEPSHGREFNRRGNARGETRNGRSRAGIATSGGGASQNATKAMMTDKIAARGARPRAVLDAANPAREGEGGGRCGCGEEALQQKRIERERADRDAPCNRPLPETLHPRSL
jgi:hypothetical protein